MSEVAEAPQQAETTTTAGALLRRAREASGLHVAALAVALKVPVRKLEALEDNRFEELGDAVFIRALASSVCRNLKVDAHPILERLPQTAAPRLIRDTDGLNEPFRAPGDAPAPSWVDLVRQPVPLAVLALVVGAAVIGLLPVSHVDDKPVAAITPAQASVPAAPAAFVAAPSMPAPAPAAEQAGTAQKLSVPAVAPTGPAQVAPAPAPSGAVAAPVSATGASATAPGPSTGIVVVRARGESWVEVLDAKGVVVVRKIMAAGEAAGASGPLPLTVTVGKADVTDVEVRGRKFDLRAVSKDNVARFEVK